METIEKSWPEPIMAKDLIGVNSPTLKDGMLFLMETALKWTGTENLHMQRFCVLMLAELIYKYAHTNNTVLIQLKQNVVDKLSSCPTLPQNIVGYLNNFKNLQI
jgi:hypothetical protein